MKSYILIPLSLVTSIQLATAQNILREITKTDTIVSSSARQFITGVPGRVFSAGVIKNGKIHLYNIGMTEKDSGHLSSDQTLFEIGSITKTFTSVILAHAVLEKRVKPTDDIRKYLHGDYPNLAYAGKPIELINLVNLTSGLPDNMPANPESFANMPADVRVNAFISLHAGYTKEKFMNDLYKVKLDTIPGLIPRHSNTAAQLLAYILEEVYQQPLATLMKRYVTGPLNMSHTFFTVPADKLKLQANGYTDKGLLMPHFPANDAFGLCLQSSIADMARYTKYQLDERDPAVKLTHQTAWGSSNGSSLGWNWFIENKQDGKLQLHDDGTTFGFTAEIIICPKQQFGIVILTNEYDQNSNYRLGQLAEQIYAESNYSLAERSSLDFGFSSSIHMLFTELNKQGFNHAPQVAERLKKDQPAFDLTENEVNAWGYALIKKGKTAASLEIFKLNVGLYPKSANAYDSLAEAEEATGNKVLAIQNYQHSLILDPNNNHAIEHLKHLKKNQ